MHPFAKLIAAAAAVIVVAVVGINLLGARNQGPGGQTPTPSPTVVSPSPSVTPANAPVRGSLAAGTYRLNEAFQTLRPFTFTVPDGWQREDNLVANAAIESENGDPPDDVFGGDGVSMATWPVSHIYRDSCAWTGTLQQTSTAAEVVDALVAQTGHEKSEPTSTTLAGLPATRLELSLAADTNVAACDDGVVRLWPDAGPNEQYGLPIDPGQTDVVYVLDFDGKPQLIIAISNESSPPADVDALQQVIDSIRFD